jgi:hypothetical protein
MDWSKHEKTIENIKANAADAWGVFEDEASNKVLYLLGSNTRPDVFKIGICDVRENDGPDLSLEEMALRRGREYKDRWGLRFDLDQPKLAVKTRLAETIEYMIKTWADNNYLKMAVKKANCTIDNSIKIEFEAIEATVGSAWSDGQGPQELIRVDADTATKAINSLMVDVILNKLIAEFKVESNKAQQLYNTAKEAQDAANRRIDESEEKAGKIDKVQQKFNEERAQFEQQMEREQASLKEREGTISKLEDEWKTVTSAQSELKKVNEIADQKFQEGERLVAEAHQLSYQATEMKENATSKMKLSEEELAKIELERQFLDSKLKSLDARSEDLDTKEVDLENRERDASIREEKIENSLVTKMGKTIGFP